MQIFYLSILLLFTIGCSTHIDSRAKQHSTYLDKRYFNKLDFSTVVLQTVKVDGNWYYVRKDGKAIRVISNKEGKADAFKEG
jgi:hypothetical protein